MAEGGDRYYTEWTPRPIKRSMYEYENESKEANTILNILGYGSIIRQKRIDAYKEYDRIRNAQLHLHDAFITVGSKAEGLTCTNESDTDSILVLSNTICLEDGVDESIIAGHINILQMKMQSCNAGYCRLLLVRLARHGHPAIFASLCDDGYGRFIMSSTFFVEDLKKCIPSLPTVVIHARAGPSTPLSNGPFRHDLVGAIRCNCPVLLHKWASRARHWPPPDCVAKVIAMAAFVTPIGFKYSQYNHMEWRICFNTAEAELVNNLNDTKVKVYVLLKMIVNDVLKPQTKEITSYLVKNVVLWLAENNPQTLFHSESLFHWLHEGLDMLRTAISFSHLPYYMIPDRNLMAERGLEIEQQRVLVLSITDMMQDGPRVLLRLNKIRKAIICHPEPMLWYSKMRTELEILDLIYNNRLLQCTYTAFVFDETDSILQACKKRNKEILYVVMWRMHLEGSSDDLNVLDMMLG